MCVLLERSVTADTTLHSGDWTYTGAKLTSFPRQLAVPGRPFASVTVVLSVQQDLAHSCCAQRVKPDRLRGMHHAALPVCGAERRCANLPCGSPPRYLSAALTEHEGGEEGNDGSAHSGDVSPPSVWRRARPPERHLCHLAPLSIARSAVFVAKTRHWNKTRSRLVLTAHRPVRPIASSVHQLPSSPLRFPVHPSV